MGFLRRSFDNSVCVKGVKGLLSLRGKGKGALALEAVAGTVIGLSVAALFHATAIPRGDRRAALPDLRVTREVAPPPRPPASHPPALRDGPGGRTVTQ